jgi:TonB family protein
MKSRVGVAATVLLTACLLNGQDTPSPQSPSSPQAPATAEKSVESPRPMVRLLRQVLPAYPKDARKAKVEGEVVLEIVIADNGSIKVIHVVSGPPVLADAAVKAVHLWQYEPAVVANTGPGVRTKITMNFRLHNKNVSVAEGPQELYAPPPATLLPTKQAASEDGTGPIYTVGGRVTVPHVIYDPEPEYSTAAREAKIEGTVILKFILTAEGKPHDIKVIKSLRSDLDQKANDAVNEWKFEPATKDGKPVAVELVVQVDFRLY